ncbi:MAG: hypothetical protein EU539_01725 [Promethearchaeota archaeon]|nr:MAG: hypothetical protein EU539_01725 [Candidatus Lokiarchaeota archaeon]
MKLDLTDLNNGSVYIGDKLDIRTTFNFDEDSSILWSGLRLITHPPCAKELQIAKAEIFSKGNFEAGEYIRERGLIIKSNVVPTIKKRNIEYIVQMILRQKNPIDPDDYIIVKKEHDIEIQSKEAQAQAIRQNPISFSISGLNVSLSKDIFRPGETVKINYKAQNYKQIELRLLQSANIVCYCEAYGENCRQVEELPPAIAGDVKTNNTKEGFMLLKIPEIAEPTHNYLWEPTEKEYWGFRYGDYTKWSILVLGKPSTGKDIVKFEVPITIVSKPISEEKADLDLFAGKGSSAPALFDGISSKFQKTYKVTSIESDLEKYRIRIENISKNDLEGVTVKLTGLQEGLFETAPELTGFNKWKQGEEKVIAYETKQNISALISLLEDNSQKKIHMQNPVSADFF